MDTNDLAAKMFDDQRNSDSFWGVIFKYSDVKQHLESGNKDLAKYLRNAIVGQVRIQSPSKPCNGAFEVKSSSGPGAGKLVYTLASHMSEKLSGGGLIPDRDNLSQDALNSWKKFAKSNSGHALDDATNPINNDPNDDCDVWKGGSGHTKQKYERSYDKLPEKEDADAVNKSYITKNSIDVKGMLDRGAEIYEIILSKNLVGYFSNAKINSLLADLARDFFTRNYHKG